MLMTRALQKRSPEVIMRVLGLILLVLSAVCGGAAYAQEEKPADATASQQQSQQQQPAQQQPAQQQVQQTVDPAVDRSTIVYVSDFELNIPNGKDEKGQLTVAPAPAIPATGELEPKKEESPAEQAGKLVDLMSSTLVKELEKAGYTARRLRPNEARPEAGVQIRGVFAEPDQENRLRRAVVGEGLGTGEMDLFVGVSNLGRPDQALYAFANGKDDETKAGAVITVSSYAPIAKFELQKDVTEKAVKDTASKIVADLTLLLNSNIAAVTH
jgi:Domain of unknown function (DUF4410)